MTVADMARGGDHQERDDIVGGGLFVVVSRVVMSSEYSCDGNQLQCRLSRHLLLAATCRACSKMMPILPQVGPRSPSALISFSRRSNSSPSASDMTASGSPLICSRAA